MKAVHTCSGHPRHYIEIYQSSYFLESSIIEFITKGLSQKEAVIIVGKDSLNKSLQRELQESFPDFQTYLQNKQIQFFDASQMLNFILENNKIDHSNFDILVGGTLRMTQKKFSQIRIYGEMVQLLAEQDQFTEALELENCWNSLLSNAEGVTLLCGYHSKTIGFNDRLDEILLTHNENHITENTQDKVKTELIQKLGKLNLQMVMKTQEEERKEESNILQMTDDLQHQLVHSLKLHHLGELTAGISHEIVNPVTIINGNLLVMDSLMRDGDFTNPLFTKNIESIRQASARIDIIVRNVLKAARKNHSLVDQCNVVEAIQCVVEILKPQLKELLIQVEFNPGAEQKVTIGQSELIQIILNIMLNARDSIRSSRSVGLGKIKIIINTSNEGKVEIRISDNGSGIRPEDQERIFQPFFTTKKEGEGTGLGLSIAKQIIEKNKGTIKLESSSIGATFCLSLPLVKS